MRFLILLLTLITLPGRAESLEEEGWLEQLNRDGVKVHTRPMADSKYQEFLASIEMEATTAQAIALLQDNSVCTQWLYRCMESRTIQQISKTERYFYQATKLPFPARARDAVFHAQVFYHPDKSIVVVMNSAPNEIPETSRVRIREAHGIYLLVPLEEGRIRVTWQQYVDPAGALPAWLVNSMMTDLPFKSLQAFRKLVREAPYRNATFGYDETGAPIEIMFEEQPATHESITPTENH